ncbi:MAG: DMT family transporter [Pseudophaeobacter sp. bin_em_oilr2.035]|uniref:DMT family transporter n=1 Tax=Phaeobacter gallaeciensis TaxID=60890 RepID=A0ABD4X4Q7_9RHOB|nr:DMT family transporter [Phaeobacter gallaeciensis]MDF1770324.1 DMT family transporter [Pseudophaeobacter sp. bin_em_oilr2.035]MDE4143339.1 DMT family transporter [Phaeobacter gallaeciensis]MDE4156300.1 DMT family transporter [Phaeobacter gallaeciensis]MDE4160487.1 DMT family transporter [Phaeobacter gallaeciensis]MDE4164419.1 DMT family transporter [Phaeobacter gallaeciensis]
MKQLTIPPGVAGSQTTAAQAMLAAMAIIGISDNAVPLMAEQIGIWQFYLLRTVITLPLIWVMMRVGLGGLRPQRLGPVALRGFLVAVSMVFYFSAVALMPLAQALAGLFTSPILIVLISVLFLKHRIGPVRIGAVLLGFVGVLCVLQPDLSDFDWLILLPVCGGLFYALGSMATGLMCRGESTVSMLFAMLLAQAVIGAVALGGLAIWPLPVAEGADGFVTRGWVWPVWEISHWLLLQGMASVVGVFLITKAYQQGEASYVAVFEYSVIIVGPAFAWLVFGQTLDLLQMAGIGLIVLAGATLALRGS